MSRRYVFWRKPTGQPGREQDGRYAPALLLAEYGLKTSVNAQGQISRPLFSVHQMETAIKSAVVILSPEGEELNDADCWEILVKALSSCVKKVGGNKPLKDQDVIATGDTLAAEFFRKPEQPYTLISSLSLDGFPIKSVQIGECVISPATSARQRFRLPEHVKHYAGLAEHRRSSKYQHVKVLTKGRSLTEAYQRALNSLHVLRGLWALFAKHRSWSISLGGGKPKPIGVILTGPIHTLHHRNGKVVGDIFWGESAWAGDRDLFKLTDEEWRIVEGNRRWAMRRLAKVPFRNEIEQLIIRYALALDQADNDVGFLQLWSILENITDSIGNYDETVRRAIWPFDERAFAKELLECMRSRRNLYVHTSKSKDESDQAAYLVKEFVDVHLLRLIRNSFDAKSLAESARHLTLPRDIEDLKKQRQLVEKVIRGLTSQKDKK